MLNQAATILIYLMPIFSLAAENSAPAPAELNQFIEPDNVMLTHASADLNGDGLTDYIFVLENQNKNSDERETGQRTLKIALRLKNQSLRIVKTNNKIVFCASCGGAFGDPFENLSASTKTFSIDHYGGSSWRWTNSFQFNYSRIDNTWQLVKVEQRSFHASDPDKVESVSYSPPKDFGKIDIADFDPDNFKKVGQK